MYFVNGGGDGSGPGGDSGDASPDGSDNNNGPSDGLGFASAMIVMIFSPGRLVWS